MAWVKLDDGFPDSVAAAIAGPAACWLYVCALAYCSRNLTDGVVESSALASILPAWRPRKLLSCAEKLADVGLWDRIDRDYFVVDYQPPETVHPVRLAWNSMRRGMAPKVFFRDGYRCVHCGAIDDLTVDHELAIVRGGTNDLTNLRTLCRPCNSRKGAR